MHKGWIKICIKIKGKYASRNENNRQQSIIEYNKEKYRIEHSQKISMLKKPGYRLKRENNEFDISIIFDN